MITVGSWSYNIKHLERTVVVIWHYTNKTELNLLGEKVIRENCSSTLKSPLTSSICLVSHFFPKSLFYCPFLVDFQNHVHKELTHLANVLIRN